MVKCKPKKKPKSKKKPVPKFRQEEIAACVAIHLGLLVFSLVVLLVVIW